MDYREQEFKKKFADAATCLGSEPAHLASLKIRENVRDHQEYHELIHSLEHNMGVRSQCLQGNFQGTGYLLEQSKTKVILVEHETGLEILYIAGSVASLLGLIPLIFQCWSVIRGDGRHHPPDFRHAELRKIGEDGHLIEERFTGLDVPWAAPLSMMNTVLISAAETIDKEIHKLRLAVLELTKRFDNIDKSIGKKTKRAKTKRAKAAKRKKNNS